MKPRLLILLSRFPYPHDKGDKLRAYYQIRYLTSHYRLIVFSLTNHDINQEHLQHLEQFCESIYVFKLRKPQVLARMARSFLSPLPYQVHYFHSKALQKQLDKIVLKHQPQLIYTQLLRMAEYAKSYNFLPTTLDFMDCFSKGYERQAEKKTGIKKRLLRAESKRLKQYELECFKHFDSTTIISQQDAQLIVGKTSEGIQIVPNGIDTNSFAQSNCPKEYDIAFIGNMQYPPNVDAAKFLIQKVLPLVSNSDRLKVVLAGADPATEVLALRDKNIEVTGRVNDITPYYQQAKIFVAPMRMGTGLQNKILEAMACGIPVITTELAYEAFEPKPDCILLGANENQLAQQIDKLLASESKMEELGDQGRNFVLKHYQWSAINDSLRTSMAGYSSKKE